MYACICHAVTEREVAFHATTGAETVEDVAERCQAGTGCGTCVERISEIIESNTPSVRPCVLAAMSA